MKIMHSLIYGENIEKFNALLISDSQDEHTETRREIGPRMSAMRMILAENRKHLWDIPAELANILANPMHVDHIALVLGENKRQLILRDGRSMCARLSAQFTSRVIWHFMQFPHDFVLCDGKAEAERAEMWHRLDATPQCCLDPWFSRRVQTMRVNGNPVDGAAFSNLVSFHADDGLFIKGGRWRPRADLVFLAFRDVGLPR